MIKYTEKIIPEVFHWRNKIAAHLSAVDPYMEDNSAMLEVSLMNPISWSNPHYYASAFNWSNMEGSSNLKQWSVVEIFDRLKPRYWPEIELK
ncbi:MAG: hypothetical protein CO137_00485 [Candidatus Magasanikbacteria bacterium CG_4_9_14_3_um_filter_32_9]|uniref:Uncharacterized protein n=1 Tax=Candidatus Magasanikbacteria bacterium CG_4_9_14_3_um_filter_32_9 TaxID=1974644 RepID=A0A2M7Z7Q0_9BACT|nr:MAG: hypothetical protein CO137_00485 [Candidatus Magasanikbacteria bacterium CG_4_9_14_3_um_filter_32_9]